MGAEGNRCIMGGENLAYNEDFDYYEKTPKPKFLHPAKKKPAPKDGFNATTYKMQMLQKVDAANKAMVRLMGIAHQASTPYKNYRKKWGPGVQYIIRAVKLDAIFKKKKRKSNKKLLKGKRKGKTSKSHEI